MGPSRIQRNRAALLVVDIQERLLPAISGQERVVRNSRRLIQGAGVLRVPIFATEQYRKGLGATVPEIAASLGTVLPLEKLTFSAFGVEALVQALAAAKVSDVLLCGIETHVCIAQTALDFLDARFRVFVAADAVSSRQPEDHRIGLERIRGAGGVIVSTEMILFDLLERAGTDEFKRILALVK